MKRRVLSMILTIVMVWSLLPVTAYAATTISTVAITGVDVPVAGARPDYTAITGIGYNPTNEFDEAGKKVSGVSWYNVTDGDKLMSTTDTFVQGKTYEVAIALQVADGYEFAASDNYTSTTTATVNGNSVGKARAISGYIAKQIITVNYTFEACENPRIETIEITGVDAPSAGAYPDLTGEVAENANYSIQSIEWYNRTERQSMVPGDSFVANDEYEVTVWVIANPNYKFVVDEDEINAVEGTFNGFVPEFNYTDYDSIISFTYNFGVCNPPAITSVVVFGIDEPVAGQLPDYTSSLGGTGYTFDTSAMRPYGVEWVDVSDPENEVTLNPNENDSFVGGHKYNVRVWLKPQTGYNFASLSTGAINGISTTPSKGNSGTIAILSLEYLCKGYISNVDLLVPEPVEGNKPDFTKIEEEAYFSEGNVSPYKNGIKWYDETADSHLFSGTSSTYVAGNEYTVTINLTANENFEFKNNATAKVNGKTAVIEVDSDEYATVTYTFIATHKCKTTLVEKVDATCTTDGREAYYHCDGCDKNYEDEAATKEITDITTWGVIKATGHTIEIQNKKDATETEAGYTGDEYCTVCKKVITPGKAIEKLPAKEPEVKPAAKGETVTDTKTKAKYVVTKSDATNGTVAFSKPKNKNITSVTIPSTVTIDGITYKVTSIQKNAFSGCKKLKSVTIGSNITTIGDKAFYKCTKLSKITIPAKVSKIGKQAFYGCKKLATITIKTKKLTSKKVGSKAFTGTPKNAKVKVPSKSLKSYKKFLYKKGLNKKAKIKK